MKHRHSVVIPTVLLTISLFAATPGMAQQPCEKLSGLKLTNTVVISSKAMPSGSFTPAAHNEKTLSSILPVPPFCRVTGVINATADSDIKFEVWMPGQDWNGRFEGVGNGGLAGYINYEEMATALRAGFATASTDTGHSADSPVALWAVGHPQKVVDYGYRAIHLVTLTAKTIVRNFYGVAPRYSYFSGCSNGGRQALKEAQRYPGDYDGIIAGAPTNAMIKLAATFLWDAQATLENRSSYIPETKLPAIANAVLAACEAQDGARDGILNDPRKCHFHSETLLCHGPNTDACLTRAQVIALEKIYAGPTNTKGRQIFPGLMPGGELGSNGWGLWITGSAPRKSMQFLLGSAANLIFNDRAWNFGTFDFDRDLARTENKEGTIFDATDPNLSAFEIRGGKLILYQGWSDAAVPPLSTIDYYESVLGFMGRQRAQSFIRLYMVPGLQHCSDGLGTDSFGSNPAVGVDPAHSMFASLQQWVEQGIASNTIVATKYRTGADSAHRIEMTRPLCAYPEIAKYKGRGDVRNASNFACELEK